MLKSTKKTPEQNLIQNVFNLTTKDTITLQNVKCVQLTTTTKQHHLMKIVLSQQNRYKNIEKCKMIQSQQQWLQNIL